MGYQTMIIVLLTSILLSITIISLSTVWNKSVRNVSGQIEDQQAINVATSGIDMALAQLRMNKAWRSGYDDLEIADGVCDVTLADVGVDSVQITAVGTCGEQEHTSVVVVKFSPTIPVANAALSIYGDSVTFYNSGKSFLIDGRDYTSSGSLSGNPSLNGISVTAAHTEASLEAFLVKGKVGSNVSGAGTSPSIGLTSALDIVQLKEQVRSMATLTLTPGKITGNLVIGTLAAPVIAYVPGDIEFKGNVSGAGILVVDGILTMGGNFFWKGIVISVSGSAAVNLGGSGNPYVLGSCIVGSSSSTITDVSVNGNVCCRYSSETISTVCNNLNLMSLEVKSWLE
jgi:hypothetical protein